MDPLVKMDGTSRMGLPKDPLLERAEMLAGAKLSSSWRFFPAIVAAFLLIGVFTSWKYALLAFDIPVFSSLSLALFGLGVVIVGPVIFLLYRFIVSYLDVLKTSTGLYFRDQMYSLVIEGENDGIWDWDVANNKVFVSSRWSEMFGYHKGEVTDVPDEWFSLIHPEDLPVWQQHIKLHFERREAVFRVEHRVRTSGGDYRWVLTCGHAVWNNKGKVLRMAGSATDISNLKDVEGVLQGKTDELERMNAIVKQEQVKYAALLTSIGEGIIATDKDGKVMIMNPQAASMLGREIGSSVGRYFIDVVMLEQDEKEQQLQFKDRPVIKTLLQGVRVTDVCYYFKPDGTKFPVAVTSAPVVLDNQLIGAVLVFRDITREKEIDKTKTEFVSLASHQLRTPLAAIRWYSEMLKSEHLGTLNDAQKSYLQEIYDSNRRMTDLVSALLNVSRIDLGTFAIEPEMMDFKASAESVLKELYVKQREQQLTVTSDFQEGLPMVNADSKLVRIVFQNLLSNSMKYTPKGGTVSLSVSYDDKNLLIRVSDSGVGIPFDVQSKIFTKLYRADNARIVEAEGTGLGLYIVKAIVEKGGGRIWFKSEENKGTTFFVEMPLSGMSPLQGSKGLV